MPHALVAPIEGLSVNPIQIPQRPVEVCFGCFHQKVVVIAHQDVAVKAKSKLLDSSAEQLQKFLPVLIASENCLALVASGCDVIVCPRVFDA
jgi:hypothetical protein